MRGRNQVPVVLGTPDHLPYHGEPACGKKKKMKGQLVITRPPSPRASIRSSRSATMAAPWAAGLSWWGNERPLGRPPEPGGWVGVLFGCLVVSPDGGGDHRRPPPARWARLTRSGLHPWRGTMNFVLTEPGVRPGSCRAASKPDTYHHRPARLRWTWAASLSWW